jgi:ubiquitin
MHILVKTLTRKQITLNVKPDATTESIKEEIQCFEGLHPFQQRLIFRRTNLEDEKTVQDYSIELNSTLDLVIVGRVVIFVEMFTGQQITLQVEPTFRIEDVQVMIEDKERIPWDQQRLFLAERELEAKDTLQDYSIQ